MAFWPRSKFRRTAWFGVAIAAAFFIGQLYAVSHAAEFGSDFHHHHGVPCAAQLLYETGKNFDTPVAPVATSYVFPASTVEYCSAKITPLHEPRRDHHDIRGPPLFLF